MAKRVGYAIVFTVFGVGSLLAACGDDPSASDDVTGGAAGDTSNAGGTKSAGSASGGNAGKAGSSHAGAGGDGAAPSDGGEPPMAGGAAGAGGASDGGATGSMGGSSEAGAGGAAAELVYACNSTTISHKICSAMAAADCPDATICSDCVGERNADREPFDNCPICSGLWDDFLQCGIDAFESGNLSEGIECVEGYGGDLRFDTCGPLVDQAVACIDYEASNGCPETWPVE